MSQPFLPQSFTQDEPPQVKNLPLPQDRVVEGKGATLKCASGLELIDLATGGFGYNHHVVAQAYSEQLKKGGLSSRVLLNLPLAMLLKKLAEILPDGLHVSYVCNSGEEALDSALKLSKGFHPKRSKVIVASNADYGSLSHGLRFSDIGSRYLSNLPLTPVAVPFGDIEATVNAIDCQTCAVVLPPLLLNQGILTASPEYWQAVRQRCDQMKALLIIDERATAPAHTGQLLATQKYNIKPDVLILGGSLSGGYTGIGVYITKKPINDKVYGRRNPTLHSSTTGGNPASCVAALTALDVIETFNLTKQQSISEDLLHLQFKKMQDSYPEAIVDFHVVGSLAAICFRDHKLAKAVRQDASEKGLLLRIPSDNWVYLYPPLTISDLEFNKALTLLSSVIEQINKDYTYE
jgi:acetylornithine/succinyldiaminopimelate/putrescine aminotransferase